MRVCSSDVVYAVVLAIGLSRRLRNPYINCFEFTKSEFMAFYGRLLRASVVPRVKVETLLRRLRLEASRGVWLAYVDAGRYRACLSTLEVDKRYTRFVDAVRRCL